jgi:hypothetical protein
MFYNTNTYWQTLKRKRRKLPWIRLLWVVIKAVLFVLRLICILIDLFGNNTHADN